jgi:hypothetical protein
MPLRAGDAFGSIQERVEELGDRLQAAGLYGELVAKKGTELSARLPSTTTIPMRFFITTYMSK